MMSAQLIVQIILAVFAVFSPAGAVIAIYRMRAQKNVDTATASEITARVDQLHQQRESQKWEDLWKEWAADRRIAGERFERLVDLEAYVNDDMRYHREVNIVLEAIGMKELTERGLVIPTPPMLPRHPRNADLQ